MKCSMNEISRDFKTKASKQSCRVLNVFEIQFDSTSHLMILYISLTIISLIFLSNMSLPTNIICFQKFACKLCLLNKS